MIRDKMGKRIPRSSTMSNWRIDGGGVVESLVPEMVVRRSPVKSLDSKPGEDHVYRPEVAENVMEYEKAR
ncbi:hypothetical protein NL676_019398 [Syzygium grande]|nr:hypothetical protein NL676_019398 [Syzygium grande]